MSSDLIPRLLEAIEVKEGKARAAQSHKYALNTRLDGRGPLEAFLADNDPSSVLRSCEADRKLVELHFQSTERMWECDLCGPEGQNIDCTYPCDTLRLMAGGYGVD